MSAYVEIKTEIKDQDALVAALVAAGIAGHALTREQIELHPDGSALRGYRNDARAQQAHVIVRRHNVRSASNDVGFELRDGKYVAHVSEFDRNQWADSSGWLGQVTQQYSRALVVRKAKKLGYRVHETVTADGSIRLALAK